MSAPAVQTHPDPLYVVQTTIARNLLLSANGRDNRFVTASKTKQLRLLGFAEKRRQLGLLELTGRWRCDVPIAWPDRRRHDSANLHPTLKAIIDGIVQDGKLLLDDDDNHLTGPFPTRFPELFRQRDMACRVWFRFTPEVKP